MPRTSAWIASLVVILFASVTQAQAQFSIRAASAQPVEGWQQMQIEHCQSRCTVWVSPTAAIVASDIENAQREINPADGATRIAVIFTDAGAKKIHDLTTAQLGKFIALVVDGELIWAPMVQAPQGGKKGVLTGDGPRGLTQDHVERILALLR